MQAANGVGSRAALAKAGWAPGHEVGERRIGEHTAESVGAVRARKVGVALNRPDGVATHLQAMLTDDPGKVVAPGESIVVARNLDLFDAGLEEAGDIHHWEVRRVGVKVCSPPEFLQIIERDIWLVAGDGVITVVA